MELFKTDMSGYYYNKNKNGITYYYSYKDKQTKKSKRKKILSCEEHTTSNLKNAINMTEDVLKNEIKKSILEEKNQNLDETLNIEHLTLNEMSKITKIAPQTLQKMEQPDSNPTLDSINKLLNAFGLKFIIKSK